jgi:hypothetical protein
LTSRIINLKQKTAPPIAFADGLVRGGEVVSTKLHYKTAQFIAKAIQASYTKKRQELITQLYDYNLSLEIYIASTTAPDPENGWAIQIEITKANLAELDKQYNDTIIYLEENSSFEATWLRSRFN